MNFSDEPGTFTLKFWTNYGGNFDVPVPLSFCAEGRGPAASVEDAGERFGNAARFGSAMLAFVANADTGLLQPELIFDVSPDSDRHDFLQILLLPEQPLQTVPSRRINLEAARAVLTALSSHSELPRLKRAIAQYDLALSLWKPGHEIQCLAHLYMCAEALTKAQLRYHLQARHISEADLISEWKIERKRLDAKVRRKLIFHEDDEAYAKAKDVSDGLEHGYRDYNDMRKPAREVIVRTAQYIRRSIISMLSLDDKIRDRLLGKDLIEPRGPLALIKYLRGTLTGPHDGLAAPDELYPLMQSAARISSVTRGDDGKYHFTPNFTFTAKLGHGVKFTPSGFEVWDGSSLTEIANVAPDSEAV